MTNNFIKTSDADIAKQLRAAGFPELPREGKLFVFINQPEHKACFDDSDVVYTNQICV